MREILFRGKRMDNGDWVFGDLIREPFGYCIQVVTGSGNGYRRKKYAISKETVGQYTGLLDKHCKRIFEGDIVYVTGLMPHPTWGYDSVTGVVEWCGGAFEVEGKANDDYVPYGLLYDSCDACREIIGNIHDNP